MQKKIFYIGIFFISIQIVISQNTNKSFSYLDVFDLEYVNMEHGLFIKGWDLIL